MTIAETVIRCGESVVVFLLMERVFSLKFRAQLTGSEADEHALHNSPGVLKSVRTARSLFIVSSFLLFFFFFVSFFADPPVFPSVARVKRIEIVKLTSFDGENVKYSIPRMNYSLRKYYRRSVNKRDRDQARYSRARANVH